MPTYILDNGTLYFHCSGNFPKHKQGNLEQYVWLDSLKIDGKTFEAYFSYTFQLDPDGLKAEKVHIGFYINRKTGELVKSHIFIKDPDTGKRAAKEIYEKLAKGIEFSYGFDTETELPYDISKENHIWAELN